MDTPHQAVEFFNLWIDACVERNEKLVKDWSNGPLFTAHIFTEPDAVIEAVAKRLSLKCYCGYYSIDAILFKEDDLVPGIPLGTTWVRRIRLALEHENYFNSGLFQEVSHLLITDCDLRVVVSYPGNPDELRNQLEYLRTVIAGSDRSKQIADSGAFLFIAGWRDVQTAISWHGYIFEDIQWRKL